tara:strand:- start:29 stop:238 length:210 start_codon:yes stop_codon:yes gene_type:complete
MIKNTIIEKLDKTDQFIIGVALQDYLDKVSNENILNNECTVENTLKKVERIFDYCRESEITLSVKEIQE